MPLENNDMYEVGSNWSYKLLLKELSSLNMPFLTSNSLEDLRNVIVCNQ